MKNIMAQKSLLNSLIIMSLFGIAMGLLESAVVVYLRELYYPDGFSFPITPIDSDIVIVEVFRELATLIMLICIGWLAGRTLISRFAWFIFAFAVWDIFYYVFLKLFLNWPESLFTSDLLFLIPTVWIGPVMSPLIISFTMIAFALVILYFENKQVKVSVNCFEWTLLILGSIILIVAFSWEFAQFMIKEHSFSSIWCVPGNENIFNESLQFIPQNFNWLLFWIGESVIVFGILKVYFKCRFILKSRQRD